MQVIFPEIKKSQTLAIALSGGSDSMALLHFALNYAKKIPFNVIAINVEHGIRGENSIADSCFVKNYCDKNNIPLLSYKVDALSYSKENKLSIETSARILRYNCFSDAIKNHKCDFIATAHHKEDNAETVLFNLFRGTGIKGLAGIKDDLNNKIIRPFINIDKKEILEYVEQNKIPFVTDETNLDTNITRNNLRLNVIPKILEIFPDFVNSLSRLSKSALLDEEYLSLLSKDYIEIFNSYVKIKTPIPYPLFSRAFITALKNLGIEKDWETIHIDSAYSLIEKKTGTKINLLGGLIAIKEYDSLVLYVENTQAPLYRPFSVENFLFNGREYEIRIEPNTDVNLKAGLYFDLNKIPPTAVIRTRKDKDLFTNFGGKTKLLSDYFIDKKVPLRSRDFIPLICDGDNVLAIFDFAISENVKVDKNTKNIINIH